MPTIESVVEEEVIVTYKDPIEKALKKRLAAGSQAEVVADAPSKDIPIFVLKVSGQELDI